MLLLLLVALELPERLLDLLELPLLLFVLLLDLLLELWQLLLWLFVSFDSFEVSLVEKRFK